MLRTYTFGSDGLRRLPSLTACRMQEPNCMYLAQRHLATEEDHIPPGIDEYKTHRLAWRFLQVSTIAAIGLALGLMMVR